MKVYTYVISAGKLSSGAILLMIGVLTSYHERLAVVRIKDFIRAPSNGCSCEGKIRQAVLVLVRAPRRVRGNSMQAAEGARSQ